MQEVISHCQKPSKYAKISLEVHRFQTQDRIKLTTLVIDDSLSIAKSAKKVGIKLSTAKLIIKKYKQEGTFFESRTEKKKRIENQETPLEHHLEQNQNLSQTKAPMSTSWPLNEQFCYYVDIQTGLIYFPINSCQTIGLYQ